MEENKDDYALTPAAAAAVIVSPERFQLTPRVKEECVVQVTNVSFETVLFRMLTTSPQRYLVKPTKGVIKPNASVTIVIVLNASVVKKEGNPFLKSDDFRLEYSIMRPTDVIGPHCSNVGAIVKERKAANRRLVHVKTLRCTLNLPEEDEAVTADAAEAAARGTSERQQSPEGAETEAAVASLGSPERTDPSDNGSTGAGVAKMDPRELEQNTLAAKNRRQLAQQQQKNKKLLLIVFAALAALLGILIMAR